MEQLEEDFKIAIFMVELGWKHGTIKNVSNIAGYVDGISGNKYVVIVLSK